MFNRIVLLTDEMKNFTSADVTRRDLEGNSSKSTSLIKSSLEKISKEVIHYTDIPTFISNIHQHKEDIIFPMRYGDNSATSKGLIPSICESNHLTYVGADSYTHILCNDKYLSKMYASEFGISSAKSILVRNFDEVELSNRINNLKLPLVVKPNFGGGSTGISINNVANSYQIAIDITEKLLKSHNIPILIEEYIKGYEVEYIMFGNKQIIELTEEVKLLMNDEDFFENTIWGFETKKLDDSSIDFASSSLLSEHEKLNFEKLFYSFDKIEFMRIDGRIHNDQFYLIELSPDCYLGDDCAFYYAFKNSGYSYTEMLTMLISNAQVPC
ncbi:hypothetical protein A8L34_12145 [Bacillus sp. FJAT-27264]|uniref:hypothetical protein n=1 Tax=Paenibacillus sp. (strain DSM 101736 / FJAT-27264) TaxID=1850362 RepID=UPI000807B2C6|nr:hypothetical protein [Bacillus sp. FJAT-27264]OBZ14664.1 hypothetical protein A8L34_12145 [Bacillus sp. FJAT-27264]